MSSNAEEKHVRRPLSEYFQATSNSTLPLVKIYVGPERKLFIFPEALVCDKFKFFKAAFQGGFRESTEKTIDLPEDDPVAFSLLIDLAVGGGSFDRHMYSLNKDDAQLELCKAYVMADKLSDEDIVMRVDRELLDLIYGGPLAPLICPKAAVFVYDHKNELKRLRMDMVGIMADTFDRDIACFSAENMEKWLESATSHPKFHADIMIKIKQYQELQKQAQACNDPFCKVHTAELMAQIHESQEFL